MTEDSKVVPLRQPDEIDDPLTAVLRTGARRLLEQAIEAEVAAFLAERKDLKLPDGRDRLVRHGCIFSSISASCVHGNRTPMFIETGQPFS